MRLNWELRLTTLWQWTCFCIFLFTNALLPSIRARVVAFSRSAPEPMGPLSSLVAGPLVFTHGCQALCPTCPRSPASISNWISNKSLIVKKVFFTAFCFCQPGAAPSAHHRGRVVIFKVIAMLLGAIYCTRCPNRHVSFTKAINVTIRDSWKVGNTA